MSTKTLERPISELSRGTMCMNSEATLELTSCGTTALLGEPSVDALKAPAGMYIRFSAEGYDSPGHTSSMVVVEPGFALAEKRALAERLDGEALSRLAANFAQRPGADDEE